MIKYFLLFMALSAAGWANSLPKTSSVPGGIVALPLADASAPAPQAYFEKAQVMVIESGGMWTALVGLPLGIEPGAHHVEVAYGGGKSGRIDFQVEGKDYPAQYITIKNQRMVNPNPEDLKRIAVDRVSIDRALDVWTKQRRVDTGFIPPVDGKLSSLFGLRRFFNNQPKDPHSGLDIAAPSGTPIKAPAPATVIGTGNYYYNGNTVFLDHGQGLITGYFHMSEVKVKPGQRLKRGEVLGAVGETGRVTGPHLHWNVYLNNTKVDPALFISKHIPKLAAANEKPRAK
ncbi:MAG: peptidoglycan DD-metalloendopeptidase family protein [Gammaproteobacteria bacterium]